MVDPTPPTELMPMLRAEADCKVLVNAKGFLPCFSKACFTAWCFALGFVSLSDDAETAAEPARAEVLRPADRPGGLLLPLVAVKLLRDLPSIWFLASALMAFDNPEKYTPP